MLSVKDAMQILDTIKSEYPELADKLNSVHNILDDADFELSTRQYFIETFRIWNNGYSEDIRRTLHDAFVKNNTVEIFNFIEERRRSLGGHLSDDNYKSFHFSQLAKRIPNLLELLKDKIRSVHFMNVRREMYDDILPYVDVFTADELSELDELLGVSRCIGGPPTLKHLKEERIKVK